MEFQISFKVSDTIYIKDPESSTIGKQIIKSSIDLINELGFENFTLKKLATEINSTEATIYRYFENKHKILLYILNWYWCYIEYLVMFEINNVTQPKEKLQIIIKLLTEELPDSNNKFDYNKKFLNNIIISEGSKAYLVKNINEINAHNSFKPYKELCNTLANNILEFNPNYKYPKSLSSTIIETAHNHIFFCKNLPNLTDSKDANNTDFTYKFLHDLLFSSIS